MRRLRVFSFFYLNTEHGPEQTDGPGIGLSVKKDKSQDVGVCACTENDPEKVKGSTKGVELFIGVAH